MTAVSEPIPPQLARARELMQSLRDALAQVIVGQQAVVEQVLWALLGGGHVLLEGNPGLGKTLLVRTLASCLKLRFSRIQFTPDLMPSDVLGTQVLSLDPHGRATGAFELHRGPIFGQLVLADEINRATPKTQSALLEAMQEHAVTIGGHRHELEAPFMVLATQNPIEMEGTFPLPEAQLDRFLLQVLVPAPSEEELVAILERTTGNDAPPPEAVVEQREVLQLRELCRTLLVSRPVTTWAAKLVAATDPNHPSAPPLVKRAVRFGAGVRAGQAMVLAAKARALLAGRPQVSLQDIEAVAASVLRHRLVRSFEGEADGVRADQIVAAVLAAVPDRPEAVQRAAAGGPQ